MSVEEILRKHEVLNIAHRGARSLAPENTLAAAARALAAGSHMWELDVGMTRDGELLVIHDSTLQRTSNARTQFPRRRPWNLHDFTLDEIRCLDFGSWFVHEDPFGEIERGGIPQADVEGFPGLHAPTLAEALDFTRGNRWCVNVEIKDLAGTPGHGIVVKEVVTLVGSMNMRGSVLVSSFNHDYLEEARRLDPELHLGVLTSRRLRDPLRLLRRLGALSYHPRISALAPGDARLLQDEGFHTLAWVANEAEAFLSLRQEGVRGIFTDFPQRLAAFLNEAP